MFVFILIFCFYFIHTLCLHALFWLLLIFLFIVILFITSMPLLLSVAFTIPITYNDVCGYVISIHFLNFRLIDLCLHSNV